MPVDPRQAALAVGQRDLCRPALEQALVRSPRRKAFDLVQDSQGVFDFAKAVELTFDRLSRPGGRARARKFSQVEEFRLHFPVCYKLRAQPFHVMVKAKSAAKGAVDEEQV